MNRFRVMSAAGLLILAIGSSALRSVEWTRLRRRRPARDYVSQPKETIGERLAGDRSRTARPAFARGRGSRPQWCEVDPKDQAGTASMTGSLLIKGTGTRPAPADRRAIESLGGSIDSAHWEAAAPRSSSCRTRLSRP